MTDHVTLMREHAAQLRAQADRYDQAIRCIVGDGPPAEVFRRPTVTTTAVRLAKVTIRDTRGETPKRTVATPDVLERHRKAVEQLGLTAAAEKLGVKYNTLMYQAKRGDWKVYRNGHGRPAAEKPADTSTPKRKYTPRGKGMDAIAAKDSSTALRRCERCQQMTRSNPCQHCGFGWKREK
jgi:predicted RNA-binding Zn-ribbon protein involved in translation (DUF1610 family)